MIGVLSNLESLGDGIDPWCDLSFEIVSVKKPFLSGRTDISFAADAGGATVGFAATFRRRDWTIARSEQTEQPDIWWGAVTLHSTGGASDNLLSVVQDFYDLPRRGAFPARIECKAVSLEGNPTDLSSGPVRTKLFLGTEGDESDDDRYAEIYLNVDLRTGYGALNEKDPDYRVPLESWFSSCPTMTDTIQ